MFISEPCSTLCNLSFIPSACLLSSLLNTRITLPWTPAAPCSSQDPSLLLEWPKTLQASYFSLMCLYHTLVLGIPIRPNFSYTD